MKNRFLTAVVLLSFLLCMQFPAVSRGEEETGTPEELKNLYARSAVLMDGDSGRVLFGKNEKEVLAMASTTKIMTCILALELAEEEEICEVSAHAAAQPQVHLGMRAGENYYLGDLLYSMMLESHNDSAVCVAEHIGGSVEGFAELMNRKAAAIGCSSTHYVTPNGLDGEDGAGEHATTAEDLALVMRYCISRSEVSGRFLAITGTAQYQFHDLSGSRSFHCTNHNALLGMMEGALSGKTGYTSKAGYCYVGAVRRGDATMIVALLACGWPSHRTYKWSDTRRLAEYGFSRYEKKYPDFEELPLPEIKVLRGEKETIRVRVGSPPASGQNGTASGTGALLKEGEEMYADIELPEAVLAPVWEGEVIGAVICRINEWKLGELPLCAAEDADEKDIADCARCIWEALLP